MKIQSIKRIKLNKIGTVAAVLILCCISFTAGVDLTQNANSAGSASVLPVAKGGTGSNNAAEAASNILGTNFENYSGVLPLNRGGTQADSSTDAGKITAQRNQNNREVYRYGSRNASMTTVYEKVADVAYSASGFDADDQIVFISGVTSFWSAPTSYLLTVGHRPYPSYTDQVYLVGLDPRCSKGSIMGFEEWGSGRRKIFMKHTAATQPIELTFMKKQGDRAFSPETLTTVPTENKRDLVLNCYAMNTPLATPTP
jgi:hypothetical protein